MTDRAQTPSDAPGAPHRAAGFAARTLPTAALVAALAAGVLLSVRPLTSPDLGYHLAYGETFLDTGRVVDSSPNVYTVTAMQQAGERAAPGPGCWYDADGTYRFANANWGSQIVLAAAHRAAGVAGLSALQAGLIAGVLALAVAVMRRLGVSTIAGAGGVLLIVLTAYARFNLRPEVFGYLLLAAQLFVLVRRRFTARSVVGLIALQLLLVNLHSYFALGLALTGAVLGDRLLRLGWRRMRRDQRADDDGTARDAKLLGIALAGQLAACFVNPWTWRLAVLPVETVRFLATHRIPLSDIRGGGHPWSHIGEFFRPFAVSAFRGMFATYAYVVVLSLGACGVVAATARRRWATVLLIAGMAYVSLQMRRNIAPGAILIVPLALGALAGLGRRIAGRISQKARTAAKLTTGGAVLAGSAVLAVSILTQHFYWAQRSPWRFGVGLSETSLPLSATRWINRHEPAGRVWCDYNSSSNVHYFTRPHRDVPILTNTWAYPPAIMGRVLGVSRDPDGRFAEVFDEFGVQTVVLGVDASSAPLAGRLARSPDWTPVEIGAIHAVFVRTFGDNRPLAREHALTPATFDTEAHIRRLRAMDPVPASSLTLGGLTLLQLGWSGPDGGNPDWLTPAIAVLRAAAETDGGRARSWNRLGLALTMRGNHRLVGGDTAGGLDDLRQARKSYTRALRIDPDYRNARDNLRNVNGRLEQLRLAPAPR